MRTRVWACLAVAALCLVGCKGFWDAPNSDGGGGGGKTTLTSGDIYVLNVATSEMVGLYVNSGTLTQLGSHYTLSAAPIAITVAPNNAFLYVSTVGGIFVYNINTSNGLLTLGNSGQPISSDPATSMQVDSTNSWLIEGFSGTPNLFAVHVNPSTGLLASNLEQTVALPSAAFQQVAISPDNTLVLVAMGTGGTTTIPFNSANANPFGAAGTPIAVKNVSGAALSVAFDPIPLGGTAPRLFYVGETVATSGPNTGGLRAFSYSSRQEVSGSPFAIGGLAPFSILPFSNGNYVYVVSRQTASGSTGVIAGFSVSNASSTLALTPLAKTFATGAHPQAMVEDSTKQFVFAVNFDGNPDLIGYTLDATKAGYLDSVISNSTGTDPVQAGAIAALH